MPFPLQSEFVAAAERAVLGQQAVEQQAWLEARMERVLPKLMAEYDARMWILSMREYAEDPVFWSITAVEPVSLIPTPCPHPTIKLRSMRTVEPWPTEMPLSELLKIRLPWTNKSTHPSPTSMPSLFGPRKA